MRILATWILIGLVVAECVARWGLGLGDPPLLVIDPQVGYMFAPNQDVMRFGNHVVYNTFSMRSDFFGPRKRSPGELRVMVIGDSVVNGGALTDQGDLATERLKRRLRKELGRQVFVGNISAGGWGASNECAYVRHFGLFDADIVVIVENSDDAFFAEPYIAPSSDFPTRKPQLAMTELIERYLLPRIFPRDRSDLLVKRPPDTDQLMEMIDMARKSGAEVLLAHHPNRAECGGDWVDGHDLLVAAAEQSGLPLLDMRPYYQEASKKGITVYRDAIHLSPAGQGVLADVLEPILIERLAARMNHTAHMPGHAEGNSKG
ncbi:MAG: SGNH/GDSL hydrolase family protein [Phycisphaerales bacterium]